MMKRSDARLLAVVLLFAVLPYSPLYSQEKPRGVPIPEASEILKTLKKGHPRLLVPAGEEERVKKSIAESETASDLFKRLLRQGDRCLAQEPIQYKLTQRSMLTLKPLPGQAQNCIVTCASLYRLTGEKKYFDRAVLEMDAVCSFADWNPGCDLDPALLTVGVALGYDWLWHDLSPEQRTRYRESIRDKGLVPGKEAYEKKHHWTYTVFNHNQACAGGMTVGALAIAEDEPELSALILHNTCKGIQRAMSEFALDGGTREGPGYWSFAVQYNIFLLSALDTALGTDFGLSGLPGFAETGRFRTHFITPLKSVFTYGDTQSNAGASWAMHWLARKFDRPAYAWQDRTLFKGNSSLNLWWAVEEGDGMDEPTAMHFERAGLVFMRSSWEPDAVYVAMKAGTNDAGHAHLELGHFMLVADERLWLGDLGSPVHFTSDYFKKDRRWTYYQTTNLAHNIPHIDGKLQNVKGVAPVTVFETTPQRTVAELDLTDAYKGQVASAKRRITLENRVVTVEDLFEGVQGETFTWQFHAPVRAALIDEKNPRLVRMQHHHKRMHASLVEPDDAVFEFEPIFVPEGQDKPPENSKRIVVRRPVGKAPIRLTVRFEPQQAAVPTK